MAYQFQGGYSMILWYKNSVLASIVSILGCVLVMAGIAMFGDEPGGAVAMILIGAAMAIWGKVISNNKAFKKWWKQVKDNNLESAVASDLNTAIVVYQKNPQERTIKKIATLNPAFAEHIRKYVANKK